MTDPNGSPKTHHQGHENGNRAWIESVLRHEAGDVPYNFLFCPPALRLAEDRYGSPIDETLNLPIRMGGPGSIKPLYADPDDFGPTVKDEFGTVWSTSKIDRGSPIGPSLTEPSLAGYTFPDPEAAYRFEGVADWCRQQEGHYRILWVAALWECATFMRGMEGLLLDVALHPAFVEALMDGLVEHAVRTTQILLETCEFEGIAVSDDYGTQNAMLISPDDWRRFVKPGLARVYDTAKSRGKTVFHHSCGHIVPIIGDMIDIGLDILHPIQPEAMDSAVLKREFGSRLTFCGGIPTQELLVTGTPAQVREEVRRLKATLGRDGGYILEPGITIQADVPLANMSAMIDEAMRPGIE